MSIKRTDKEKIYFHKRNRNRNEYDLKAMSQSLPELHQYVSKNKYGNDSINFSDPKAVRVLNKAILKYYYEIDYWEFPNENLTPPIPGRAEYIHLVADLLGEKFDGHIPKGKDILCLDIGVGASCVYPIIGVVEYGWNFICSDVNPESLSSTQKIIDSNDILQDKIVCREQKVAAQIFKGIIRANDKIAITICNPPFHASRKKANKGTSRKLNNLTGKNSKNINLNFSGMRRELVYQGGEIQFISNMISESELFSKSCVWFSTLVSKESNLKILYKILKAKNPTDIITINLNTGNKKSRILAWTFI